MMYQNFQTYTDSVAPLRSFANIAAAGLTHPLPGISRNVVHRAFHALYELIARTGLSHRRPAFGIDQVEVAGHAGRSARGCASSDAVLHPAAL